MLRPGLRIVALAIACLVIPGQLRAQSTVKIEGYVHSSTGEPLVGVNVVVLGTAYGATTEPGGRFFIENLFAGQYELQVSHIGYQSASPVTVTVEKTGRTTCRFVMTPMAIPLEEVVVTGRPVRQSSSSELFSRERIERSGATSLAELLVRAGGVEIQDDGQASGASRISVRGSNSNQVVVLYDGIPLNDPLTGEVDLRTVGLATVETVQIHKGGASSSFGSGALGGVVEITSRRYSVDELKVNLSRRSFSGYRIQPYLAGGLQRMSYVFNYEHMQDGGRYPYTYIRGAETLGDTRINADFTSNSYFGKVGFENGPDRAHVQVNINRSDRGLPGLVFSWTPYARATNDRSLIAARYVHQRSGWRSQWQGSYHVSRSEFLNAPPADAALRYRVVPPYHSSYRVKSARLASENVVQASATSLLHLNVSALLMRLQDQNQLSGFLDDDKRVEQSSAAVSVLGEFSLPRPAFLQSLELRPELRLDFYRFDNVGTVRDGQHLSPRLGLIAGGGLAVPIQLHVTVGRSFRLPTFADLFFQDFRISGNPELLPETSSDFEGGLSFRIAAWPSLSLAASYFHQAVDNLIIWELGSFGAWQPRNSRALRRGLELDGNLGLFADRLQLRGHATFLDALNRSGEPNRHNRRLPYHSRRAFKVSALLNFNWLLLEYRRQAVSPWFVLAANTKEMPGYVTDDVNISLVEATGRGKFTIKGSLINVWDERYELVRGAPLAGRRWRLSLEAKLN